MGGAWLHTMRDHSSIRRPAQFHRAGVALVILLVMVATWTSGVVAAEPPAYAVTGAPGPVITSGPASISPGVSLVAVDSVAFRAAEAEVQQTSAALGAARGAREATEARLVELAARDVELDTVIAEASARRDVAAADFDEARGALRAIAVASYVRGSEVDPLEVLFDQARGTQIEGETLLIETVTDDQAGRLEDARDRREEAARTIDEATRARRAVRADALDTTAARDAAAGDEARLVVDLDVDRDALEQARALAIVVGVDFPLVALDTYYRAASQLARQQPGCGLPWWALAGIGKVESRHGSFGSTRLAPDGSLSRPIIGIPLDGTSGTRLIADTDGGALDGDPVVDRAVGPMQFIPSTWARWGRDGNGDGTEDPQNLYDAALGAGAYLCGAAPLDTNDDLRRAFLRYNVSDAYAEEVLGWALGYSWVVIPEP